MIFQSDVFQVIVPSAERSVRSQKHPNALHSFQVLLRIQFKGLRVNYLLFITTHKITGQHAVITN